MRIGIIGSGDVGRILAKGFAAKGHEVTLGARDPQKALTTTAPGRYGQPPLSAWAQANPQVRIGTFAEAAQAGEALVFAVHGANVEEAVRLAGPAAMAGKLVLDTTNPLAHGPSGAHKPASIPDSCLQVAQRAAPQAKFVKAWNCTPGAQMVDPVFKEGRGDQFICGDDADAKRQAARILDGFGWNAADVGDASMAPYVEGMALAAINAALKSNDWSWGLKLARRA